MSSAVLVRPACRADAARVAELVDLMGGHQGAGADPGTVGAFAAGLGLATSRALVAEIAGEVVGYGELQARPSVLHSGHEGWLAVLAVDPSARGGGVGRALVAALDSEAATMGCSRIVLESSTWREAAHHFYRKNAFREETPANRFVRPVHSSIAAGDNLTSRFLTTAARAATCVAGVIAGLQDAGPWGVGADGAPTEAGDRAAEDAILSALAHLGLPIVSEERGLVGEEAGRPGQPWIAVDPLDGSRNYRAGMGPYATAIGLVVDGLPVAGLVCELTSGRRWWAAQGSGAWVDGQRCRPRPGGLLGAPSPEPGTSGRVGPPPAFDRIRVSGSTATDLCRVADGSLAGWHDLTRGAAHPHDLAAPWAVLREAGAVVLDSSGLPPALVPDPTATYRIAVGADDATARSLLD